MSAELTTLVYLSIMGGVDINDREVVDKRLHLAERLVSELPPEEREGGEKILADIKKSWLH
jgi:hypothetical protein